MCVSVRLRPGETQPAESVDSGIGIDGRYPTDQGLSAQVAPYRSYRHDTPKYLINRPYFYWNRR